MQLKAVKTKLNSESINKSLLLILNLANEADIKSLTTTELVKYLYLLDYYHAQETSGQAFTSIEWKFLHFGPYSASVPSAIEFLVNTSQINEVAIQSSTKDGYLYSLTNKFYAGSNDLISRYVINNLEIALRKFRGNLSGLLNFVYFKTEPMIVALPTHILDFSMCRKFDISAIKPLPLKTLDQSKINHLRDKRRSAISAKKEKLAKLVWSGKYDDEYISAMGLEEDVIFPFGSSFRASIEI